MAQKKAKEKKTVKPVEPDRVYHISYRKLLRKDRKSTRLNSSHIH